MKSNSDYDFMRTWHYLDFPKGETYKPTNQENIINRLTLTYNELKHKNTLSDAQIKDDLCILFHLTDDLHMLLHTGARITSKLAIGVICSYAYSSISPNSPSPNSLKIVFPILSTDAYALIRVA